MIFITGLRHIPRLSLLCLLLVTKQAMALNLDKQWFYEKLLGNSNCRDAITQELDSYNTRHEWRQYANNRYSDKVYRSPTHAIGYWMEVQIRQGKVEKILRVTPEQIDNLTVQSNCNIKTKTRERSLDEVRMAAAFTDQDLQNFIDSNPQGGLILAWSPNMPLSQQMIKNTQKVAESKGIALTLVVDPHASDQTIAKAVADNHLINASRKIESLELIFQGMTTHYPSLLSFNNGEISSPVVPGVVVEPLVKNFVEEYVTHAGSSASVVSLNNAKSVNWIVVLVVLIVLGVLAVSVFRREKSA